MYILIDCTVASLAFGCSLHVARDTTCKQREICALTPAFLWTPPPTLHSFAPEIRATCERSAPSARQAA